MVSGASTPLMLLTTLPLSPRFSFIGEIEFAEANLATRVHIAKLGLPTPLPECFLLQGTLGSGLKPHGPAIKAPFEVKEENLLSNCIKWMLPKTIASEEGL